MSGEMKFTRAVCNDLKRMNALVFPIVGGKLQPPGWPDRIVWHSRWQGFLEFKGRSTQVTELQAEIIRQLNRRSPRSAFIVRWPGVVELPDIGTIFQFNNAAELLEGLANV